MEVYLNTFIKKSNSTKRPTGGAAFNVTLKDGCNIINPVLVFAGIDNPTAYNYAYIPDFNRYYYVTNWEAYRDRWTVSLSVDVLASYKEQIGASTQYVSRSESAYNGNIIDDLYPAIGSYSRTEKNITSIWEGANTHSGSFVFSVANDVSAPTGASYYVTNYAGFEAIRAILFGQDFYDLILNGIWTPGNFVLSCKWFPVSFPVNGGRISKIALGHLSWDLPDDVNVYILSNEMVSNLVTSVSVPRHPQSKSRGAYLRHSPYTQYSVFFPPFGLFDIDPGTLYDITDISFNVVTDPISGIGTLAVTAGSALFAVYQNNIGVDIPLTSRDVDVGGLVTNGIAASVASGVADKAWRGVSISGLPASAASSGAAAAAGTTALSTQMASGIGPAIPAAGISVSGLGSFAVAGGIAMAAIGNAIKSTVPTSHNITGSSGSFAPYSWQPRLISSFINIADEHKDAGRPLMEERTISDLPGYVQVIDPHFEIAMTETEMAALISAASSGFFYE